MGGENSKLQPRGTYYIGERRGKNIVSGVLQSKACSIRFAVISLLHLKASGGVILETQVLAWPMRLSYIWARMVLQ